VPVAFLLAFVGAIFARPDELEMRQRRHDRTNCSYAQRSMRNPLRLLHQCIARLRSRTYPTDLPPLRSRGGRKQCQFRLLFCCRTHAGSNMRSLRGVVTPVIHVYQGPHLSCTCFRQKQDEYVECSCVMSVTAALHRLPRWLELS
jgi:hypothetical protein